MVLVGTDLEEAAQCSSQVSARRTHRLLGHLDSLLQSVDFALHEEHAGGPDAAVFVEPVFTGLQRQHGGAVPVLHNSRGAVKPSPLSCRAASTVSCPPVALQEALLLQRSSWPEGPRCGCNGTLPPPASDTAGRRVRVAVFLPVLFEMRHAGWSFGARLVPFGVIGTVEVPQVHGVGRLSTQAADESSLVLAVHGSPAQLQTGSAGYNCRIEATVVRLLALLVLRPHLLGVVDYSTQ